MDRRTFLGALAGGFLAAPLAAEAQAPPGKVARIGYLSSGTATENARLHKAFTDGLRDYGWIEGKNITIEYRWDVTGETTLDALAAELVQLPLDVIFAVNTPASLATKRTGTTRPVVFATVSEPVGIGLVAGCGRLDRGSVRVVGYPVSLALFGEHRERLHKSSTGALSWAALPADDVARRRGRWRNVDRWPNAEARTRVNEVFQRLTTLEPTELGAEELTPQGTARSAGPSDGLSGMFRLDEP